LWLVNYPRNSITWITTLKRLRNYYLYEDVCGSKLITERSVLNPSDVTATLVLDAAPFPPRVTDAERELHRFRRRISGQLSTIANDTYCLNAISEAQVHFRCRVKQYSENLEGGVIANSLFHELGPNARIDSEWFGPARILPQIV
jgi:hypothetical protein